MSARSLNYRKHTLFFFVVVLHPFTGPELPHFRGFTIAVRHITLGRTPLDDWSAWRLDFYLTKHNTRNRQNPVPLERLEPAIPAREWSQTHPLDRAATGICIYGVISSVTVAVTDILIHVTIATKLGPARDLLRIWTSSGIKMDHLVTVSIRIILSCAYGWMTSKYLTVSLAKGSVRVGSSGTKSAVNTQPVCYSFIECKWSCTVRHKTWTFVFNQSLLFTNWCTIELF